MILTFATFVSVVFKHFIIYKQTNKSTDAQTNMQEEICKFISLKPLTELVIIDDTG